MSVPKEVFMKAHDAVIEAIEETTPFIEDENLLMLQSQLVDTAHLLLSAVLAEITDDPSPFRSQLLLVRQGH